MQTKKSEISSLAKSSLRPLYTGELPIQGHTVLLDMTALNAQWERLDLEVSTDIISRLIPGLRPASERRRYFVTTSLIGWAQT